MTAARALQQANPSLTVSVTVPAGPSGLVSSGVKFLKVAKQSHTPIDLVNIMTMDYGGPVGDMGGTAIQAAQGTGDNDVAGETFTLSDAAQVAGFAAANGVGRVAFWSLNRDQACTTVDSTRNDCSGVAQDPLEFTTTILAG